METRKPALLLVDIQKDFWGPIQAFSQFAEFPANIRSLLAGSRSRRMPVVHTQALFKADGSDWMLFYGKGGRGPIPCIAGTPGAEIEEFAAPAPGDIVICKQAFDGFVGTNLERELRSLRVNTLWIAGLVTSVCVLFTATSAYLKRFEPIVITDACADEPDRHEAVLRMYAGLCFRTTTTAEAAKL